MQNKIFLFSDIDETLIYPKNKMNPDKNNLLEAEVESDQDQKTYIYNHYYEFIDRIIQSELFEFVPVTHRTLEEYQRTFFYRDYRLKNVILNSAGNIFIDGEKDSHWEVNIKKQLLNLKIDILQVVQNFELEFYEHFERLKVPKIRHIDLQYIVIKNSSFPNSPDVTNSIKDFVTKLFFKYQLEKDFYIYKNYNTFLILPNFINKAAGVEYLINKYKPFFVIGAGDNLSDLKFLNMADFALIPQKSTLNQILNNFNPMSSLKNLKPQ